MKIGILTFHRSQNYGALLQAYGLQTFVESLGHQVYMVDYWPTYHRDMYKPFSWRIFCLTRWISKPKYVLNSIGTYLRLKKRQRNTLFFIDSFLHLSKNREYDTVLYGSDQIWRKYFKNNWGDFNPVYWGNDYVKCSHKIAYAASMGEINVKSSKDETFIKKHLSNFDAVSIREQDLIDYFRETFQIRYQLVCDPVFLINKEQWKAIVNTSKHPQEKYILYYRLQNLKTIDSIVEELARKTNCKVIETRGYVPLLHYGKRYQFTISAQEFASLVHGAEYVITSAFHGVAMSIVFEKQFYYTSEKNQSNRVQSLLNILDLEYRIINKSNLDIDTIPAIDYTKVNRKLYQWEDQSRQWLTNQLEKCEYENHIKC